MHHYHNIKLGLRGVIFILHIHIKRQHQLFDMFDVKYSQPQKSVGKRSAAIDCNSIGFEVRLIMNM